MSWLGDPDARRPGTPGEWVGLVLTTGALAWVIAGTIVGITTT